MGGGSEYEFVTNDQELGGLKQQKLLSHSLGS